jgi:hypothetical protein
MELGVQGYNGDTISLEDIDTGTCSSRFGFDASLMTLFCRRIIVAKYK